MRTATKIFSRAAAALILMAAGVAHADPTPQEKETARALMDQGDEKFEEKNYDAALKAYVGAHAIMRVPTTALEVAKAHEKLGHLVEARDALLEAVRFPKTANEPAAYTAARVDAEKHAQELGERIPSLLVKIEGAVPGYDVHLTVDKVALPPAAAQLPIKLNPGHHVVLVSSDATYDASAEADLVERQAASVTIKVSPKPVSERNKQTGSSKTLRTLGLITGGVGVIGVGIGAAFGLQASSKQDDANCPDNRCKDESSAEMLRDANSAATISNIGFIAGGVLVAAGVTMFILGSSSSREKTTTATRAYLLPTGVAGTF